MIRSASLLRCADRPCRLHQRQQLGAKLDVRGDGGYVITPPSPHPTWRHYASKEHGEPWSMAFAAAPDWLLQRVVPRPRPSVVRPTTEIEVGDAQISDAYVDGALRRGVEEVARAPEGAAT